MGGVVKAVSSVVSGAAKAVSSVASGVGSAVSGTASGVDACGRATVNNLQKSVSNVIKNPLPVIETIAIAAVAAPYVAPAVAAAGGGAAATAAATSAVSAAAVSAMNGGNVGDIATAAIASGAGSYVGQTAGAAVGAPTSGTELTTLGKIAASATGGSTTTTLKLLADGSSLSDAVSAGAKVGVAAGITTGGIEGLKAGFDTTTTAGTAPVVERSTGEGVDTTDATDTASSQNFPIAPTAAVGKSPFDEPFIGRKEERLLASALYPAVYSTLFGKQQQAPISALPTTTQQPTKPVTPTQTTVTPGSQALAQALRIGDVGTPIFGGDKEEGRRSGWNIESLRYTGNSEA